MKSLGSHHHKGMDALKRTRLSVCQCGITKIPKDRKLEAMRYLSGERAIVLDCRDPKADGRLPTELLTPRLNRAMKSETRDSPWSELTRSGTGPIVVGLFSNSLLST